MKRKIFSTAALAAIMTLSGCGGGGSSNSATPSSSTIEGQFLDSAVSGIDYKCSSGNSGKTDVSGHFICKQGDDVEFSINGFVIGKAAAAKVITPKTLYPNDQVAQTNVAQLLQTLDSDNDPNNGITIDPNSQLLQNLGANVDVDFTKPDFDTAIKSFIGTDLVDETTAKKHLELTLKNVENGAGKIMSNTFVMIVNNADQAACHTDNQATFEGYTNAEEFLNAGGSYNVEYFSTTKQCSDYAGTKNCQVQTIPSGVDGSGSGSCVTVVNFPGSAMQNGNTDGNDNGSTTNDNTSGNAGNAELTYEDFVTIYKPLMPNLRSDNIYFNGMEDSYFDSNTLYDFISSMNAEPRIFDTLYEIGGSNYSYEYMKRTFDGNTIHFDDYFSDTNTTQKYPDATFTENGNVIKYTWKGSNVEVKFSKPLSVSALQKIYSDYGMNIDFDSNDKAQFMTQVYSGDNPSNDYTCYIRLVVNESAFEKIKAAFEAKISAAGN